MDQLEGKLKYRSVSVKYHPMEIDRKQKKHQIYDGQQNIRHQRFSNENLNFVREIAQVDCWKLF